MNWFFRYLRILMQYFNLQISTTQPTITVIEYVTNRWSTHLQLNCVRLGQTIRFTKPQTKSESLTRNWNVYFIRKITINIAVLFYIFKHSIRFTVILFTFATADSKMAGFLSLQYDRQTTRTAKCRWLSNVDAGKRSFGTADGMPEVQHSCGGTSLRQITGWCPV